MKKTLRRMAMIASALAMVVVLGVCMVACSGNEYEIKGVMDYANHLFDGGYDFANNGQVIRYQNVDKDNESTYNEEVEWAIMAKKYWTVTVEEKEVKKSEMISIAKFYNEEDAEYYVFEMKVAQKEGVEKYEKAKEAAVKAAVEALGENPTEDNIKKATDDAIKAIDDSMDEESKMMLTAKVERRGVLVVAGSSQAAVNYALF